MFKSLVVLAAAGTMSGVQSTPPTTTVTTSSGSTAAAQPQTVKKRVCYQEEEDSYSRLGGRKVCKTVEVPVKPGGGATGQQAPTQTNTGGK